MLHEIGMDCNGFAMELSMKSIHSAAVWDQSLMAEFPNLSYLGHATIDLDEVPSDCNEFEAGYFYEEGAIEDHLWEAETIPGSPVQLRDPIGVIEIEDSESEVEVVKVVKVDILLSPDEEQLRMQNEDRQGHFHRLQLENLRVEARVKRVSEAIIEQTPEQRRLRRRFIREQLA